MAYRKTYYRLLGCSVMLRLIAMIFGFLTLGAMNVGQTLGKSAGEWETCIFFVDLNEVELSAEIIDMEMSMSVGSEAQKYCGESPENVVRELGEIEEYLKARRISEQCLPNLLAWDEPCPCDKEADPEAKCPESEVLGHNALDFQMMMAAFLAVVLELIRWSEIFYEYCGSYRVFNWCQKQIIAVYKYFMLSLLQSYVLTPLTNIGTLPETKVNLLATPYGWGPMLVFTMIWVPCILLFTCLKGCLVAFKVRKPTLRLEVRV